MELFGLDNYFYHGSVRRYVALFGSIFSDVYIKRASDDGKKEETIKVPIRYGNGNMYLKAPQDESREVTKRARILPAMSFELGNLYKDVNRKTNPMNRIQQDTFDSDGKRKFQFNRMPYNFIFDLMIRTKNTDDMLQIVEQIIPVFDGNLSITIEDDTGVKVDQDIIISIDEISMTDNYDDEMKGRLIEWKITFELRGYLYKKTQSAYVVKEIDIVASDQFEVDAYVRVVNEQPPITEKQNILSSMTEAFNETPSTPIKKVTRRARKG